MNECKTCDAVLEKVQRGGYLEAEDIRHILECRVYSQPPVSPVNLRGDVARDS
jgi:hypothetical protein